MDYTEEYPDAYDPNEWNEGHPLAAALIGCAVLVAGGYFGLPYLPPLPLIAIMAAAMVVALILWGIGYAITIRRANANWKLLSFLLLLGTAAGVGYYATWAHEQRIKNDMRTLMEMQIGPDGLPVFPAGAENRGPISKFYIAFIRDLSEGQRALDEDARKAGVQLLSDASALKANPALLSHCSVLTELKGKSHAMVERRREGFRAFVKAVADSDYPKVYKDEIGRSLTVDDTDANLVEIDGVQARMFDAALGACNVLARRRWVPQGPVFMFTNTADLTAFSAFGQQQNQASAELQRHNNEARMRMRNGQQMMRRGMDGWAP
jgi:hypothetical protein